MGRILYWGKFLGFYVRHADLCRSFIVMPAVVVRQRKPWRRRDGIYLYFEGKEQHIGTLCEIRLMSNAER